MVRLAQMIWICSSMRAMAPMQRVEVAGLVRRVDRHPGEARLLEIEDLGRGHLLDERHVTYQNVRADSSSMASGVKPRSARMVGT